MNYSIPKNIVRIPTLVHEDINGEYASRSNETPSITTYQKLQKEPFDVQYAEGIKIMRELGIIQ